MGTVVNEGTTLVELRVEFARRWYLHSTTDRNGTNLPIDIFETYMHKTDKEGTTLLHVQVKLGFWLKVIPISPTERNSTVPLILVLWPCKDRIVSKVTPLLHAVLNWR